MKNKCYSPYVLLLSLLLIISGSACKEKTDKPTEDKNPIVPVIFDTDISGDYDDVGAMGMLHALADKGEIEILGTVASNLSPLVAPTIEVINTYFGRPDIPVGALKTSGVYQDSRELHWPDSLMVNFPHTYKSNDDAPDAVKVYRRILAEQPDSSVTIVTVGFLSNLKNLLQSKPDTFSPLNGKDLVEKKVKHWVAMAGKFPSGKEVNVKRDSLASYYAISNWPTPIVFSGFEIGNKVLTGLRLIKEGPEDSPIRMAYAISIPKRPYDKFGRMSWDQTALLVAARGFDPYYTYKTGRFIPSEDGSNSWEDDPQGDHKYLVEKMPADSVAQVIENLMMHKPMP
ncbi:nucleoside hydrolase [Arenibacter sp. F26102]|uniref:nucleoside hydrolase n=1 Tax=Arenibacter sp. F26102 TaxID=2926416 RepID=UPI001FF5354E|nr:nucleoside hydrolase [Arenibacter sp. F26102]MCK0148229.1 nucleoside hydrolase [Arenibacter sp. F26102]